jgi:uncharacterized protein
MSFSLYDALIPTFQQTLGAVVGLVDKAEAYCAENPAADLIQARLHPDMLPFSYQVKSAAAHSFGAIEGVRRGVFSPDMSPPPESFAALKQALAAATAGLAALGAQEVNGFVGRDMRFEMRGRAMDFTAENFLLSFSLPNFYFHATTAYAILRHRGLPLGKRDFMGPLRLKV